MAFTLTRNLRLRINSGLTADAKYNLERIDLLGSTFLTDSTDTLNIRSRTDIRITPDSADLGGGSSGGNLYIGDSSHELDSVYINTADFRLDSQLGVLDQATSGTRYLRIQYKSDLSGSVDTGADRVLSLDPAGSDRSILLEGNLSLMGGAFQFTTAAGSSVTVPATGTLATLAGVETLTNKSIDALQNTITNIRNQEVASNAAIAYSKLNLLGSITNADVNAAAGIDYLKLELTGSITDSDIGSGAAISRSKVAAGNASHVLINDGSGNLSSEPYLSPARGGLGIDASGMIFPGTGNILSDNVPATLTNKTMSGSQNTFSDIDYSSLILDGSITNSDIASLAGITYSKLNISNQIVDGDISSSADISRSKIASGIANQVIINDGNGSLTSTPQLAISLGGTGTDNAQDAINALLPDQSGNTGKVLSTDGTDPEWITVSGTGTVTSVALALPADLFDISGSPVTISGTLTGEAKVQNSGTVWAGPTSGAADVPSFRSLVADDLPTGIPADNIGGGSVSNTEFGYLDGVTSGIQAQLDGKQPVDSDLTALAGVSANGLLTRTGSGTAAARTITAGAGIQITNGDGVSGNPTIESTITQYDNEMAQDAVGSILTATSSVSFAYSDATPSISASVIPGGVDHDQLLNFSANEHVDHTSVSISTSATSGLSGGGDISANRSLVVDPTKATATLPALSDIVLLADASSGNALIRATVSEILSLGNSGAVYVATWAQGDGATKSITHNLASEDVSISVYDLTTKQDILVDRVERDDQDNVTLEASQAPGSSGWRVIVRK